MINEMASLVRAIQRCGIQGKIPFHIICDVPLDATKIECEVQEEIRRANHMYSSNLNGGLTDIKEIKVMDVPFRILS